MLSNYPTLLYWQILDTFLIIFAISAEFVITLSLDTIEAWICRILDFDALSWLWKNSLVSNYTEVFFRALKAFNCLISCMNGFQNISSPFENRNYCPVVSSLFKVWILFVIFMWSLDFLWTSFWWTAIFHTWILEYTEKHTGIYLDFLFN